MAEDELLINFDIGDGPLAVKPAFKGGKWKDRLSAKKAALYNRNKAVKAIARSQTAQNGPENPVNVGATATVAGVKHPAKRQRLAGPDEGAGPGVAARSVRANTRAKRSQPSSKPHQVVSSLFTYNPTATTTEKVPAEALDKAEPSNAPLNSELDTFTSLGLSTQLAEHLLTKLDIKAPTAIQRAAVTQLLAADTDAFLQAETGSGKTLAYLLPIVQKIMTLSSATTTQDHAVHRDSGLFAIILAPTRELSKQISVVLESLLRCAYWIVSGIVIGGEKKKSEKARLRKGLNILIATPGRLADHLDHTEALDVSNVRWVVLDEGDRLMELGFEQDLQKILSKLDFRTRQSPGISGLPTKRTTVLCSATMKPNVQRLGEMSLKDAIRIQADLSETIPQESAPASPEQQFSAPAQLQQSYTIVPAKQRLVTLAALLKHSFARKGSVTKAIVFISSTDSVDFHFALFTRPNSSTQTTTTAPSPTLTSPNTPLLHIHKLHGSLPQPLRTSTLAAFRNTPHPALLLATDLAARGLDLPRVDLVIEYDPAATRADHLHRVGRTARAGAPGRAVLFLLPGCEEGYIEWLRAEHRDEAGARRVREMEGVLRRGFETESATGTTSSAGWQDRATAWQLAAERWVAGEQLPEDLATPSAAVAAGATPPLDLARAAFRAHVRAYATHVAAERGVFDSAELHLGHLAKAFALRERPGGLGSAGAGTGVGRKGKGNTGPRGKRRDAVDATAVADTGTQEAAAAARLMRDKIRERTSMASGAEEFNLG